jgi:hypothetical protein
MTVTRVGRYDRGQARRGPAGLAGALGQGLIGEQDDGRSDEGGESAGDAADAVELRQMEQVGGHPGPEECAGDARDAGPGEAECTPAQDQVAGQQARGQAEKSPGDDAHNRLLHVSEWMTYAVAGHAEERSR